MKCPNCNAEVLNENINIQTDVAKCNNCGHVFRISENVSSVDSKFDINDAPKGTWYIQDFDKTIIGASTRSKIAFFLVPFMLVWSSGALGGIFGTQIMKGKFDPAMSLFGIPFLIGAIIFWSLTLMAIWGKVELTFDKQGGKIFTGVGKIGFTKNFIWSDVSRISEGITNFRYPGNQSSSIVFEGKKKISFATGVTEERKYYLIQSLRKFHSQMVRSRIF